MKVSPLKDYAIGLYQITEKKSGVELSKSINEFAKLLVKYRLTKKVNAIAELFMAYYKKQKGIISVKISSSRKLDKKNIEVIANLFKGHAEIQESIDESLIGGLTIQTENKIIDASLKTQLIKLKQALS